MRLDWNGVKDLAYEIRKSFVSKAEAAGSMVLSGTTLKLISVDGSGELSSVELGAMSATRSGTAHRAASVGVQASGPTIVVTLYDGDGNAISSDSATIST